MDFKSETERNLITGIKSKLILGPSEYPGSIVKSVTSSNSRENGIGDQKYTLRREGCFQEGPCRAKVKNSVALTTSF
jgi:hypothetical protein